MDISTIFHVLIKRWFLIVSFAILSGIGAAVVSIYFMPNIYESSATMIIGSQIDVTQRQLTLNDYSLNVKLVNSYQILCKSNRILKQVSTKSNLPFSARQLSKKVDVTSVKDTEIIRITAQDSNPAIAAQIADTVATIFVAEIPQIMKMANVQIIDHAMAPTNPIKPNRSTNILVAAFVGLILGIGISFLLEYLDTRIHQSEQIGKILDVPMLGFMPLLEATPQALISRKENLNHIT